MTETEFNQQLVDRLGPTIAGCQVEMKRSVTYNLAFDEEGQVDFGQNASREPTRGGGTGFQNDIVVCETSASGHTQIIPRVVVELKVGSVSTHDCIVYSEKAHLIRSVYPYVRYGLLIGDRNSIPGLAKILRFGQEFDFIGVMSAAIKPAELSAFKQLLTEEVEASKAMGHAIAERGPVKAVRRKLTVQEA